ncbi:hypothetical protein [Pyramidobacter sp. C12-8]|uniref:hypothetical protein n=1 Tax=Pyramidobacter sp. C12-8 TaxID=1943580 RepID=UPI00098F6A16|nr:hypothetical protein [Pyramidobacter sp. C12-8]OON89643.1 hypothetical protein B0D78_02050 [Pyramidobacter sp. C12-8]
MKKRCFVTILVLFAICAAAPTLRAVAETTVYIGDESYKYHRKNCRTLRGNKYPLTLSEARKQGLKPCKVCNPPAE